MWFYFNRNPISYDLRKESKLFYLQLNHFASSLIMFTSKKFYRITFLPQSGIVEL